MKTVGVVRELDKLGRVVLPVEFRRMHQLTEGTKIELVLNNDGSMVLRKYQSEETVSSDFNALKQSIARSQNLKNKRDMLMKMTQLETMLREEIGEWE